MGALYGVVGLVLLLGVGLTGIAAGIVGLIICAKKRKAGSRLAKILTAVFAVVLCLGCLVAMIPIVYFSFIVIVNATPPDNYVQTDIVIEEDGYQDARFTADGTVFEVLELEVQDDSLICNPVFSYKTKGFMNRSQCGNYYAIENDGGFTLVSNELGTLFCPVEEKSRVMEYYTDPANLCGYYDHSSGRGYMLSDGASKAVQDLCNMDVEALPEVKMILTDEDWFWVYMVSKDGAVRVNGGCELLVLEDEVYCVHLVSGVGYGSEYTLWQLPREISDVLLEVHRNG